MQAADLDVEMTITSENSGEMVIQAINKGAKVVTLYIGDDANDVTGIVVPATMHFTVI